MFKVSMLVRRKPFREWVAVYYDPAKTSEEKLLRLLHEGRCRRAKVEREEGRALTVMNPCVGPGDVVQLRLGAEGRQAISKVELPEGWKLVGKAGGAVDADGVTWFSVRTPGTAGPGKQTLRFHPAEGEPLEAVVEVVRMVGG